MNVNNQTSGHVPAILLKVRIYVVCHDDASQLEAQSLCNEHYPGLCQIIRVSDASPYFESQVFAFLHEHKDQWVDKFDYVGVCPYSWKAKFKLDVGLMGILGRNHPNVDVYGLFNVEFFKKRANTKVSYIEALTIQHGPFMLCALLRMCRELGFTEDQVLSKNTRGFFCNHWIAKPQWMLKYVEFYKQIHTMMETDPVIKDYLGNNSWYDGKLVKSEEGKAKLEAISGKPYYTLHTFLLERLPALFFYMSGAEIKHAGIAAKYTFND